MPKESAPSQPVKESSSNYAGVLKSGSSGSANVPERKTEATSGQRQQTSGQRSPDSVQRSQTNNNASAEVDEFANLWKQLQASDNENSAPNTPARNKTVQAMEAKSLEPSMQMNTENIPLKPKGVTDLTVNEEDRMSPNTFTKVNCRNNPM